MVSFLHGEPSIYPSGIIALSRGFWMWAVRKQPPRSSPLIEIDEGLMFGLDEWVGASIEGALRLLENKKTKPLFLDSRFESERYAWIDLRPSSMKFDFVVRKVKSDPNDLRNPPT